MIDRNIQEQESLLNADVQNHFTCENKEVVTRFLLCCESVTDAHDD